MEFVVNFFDSEIYKTYPEVLDILLVDRSTNKNIVWATDIYEKHGPKYREDQEINKDLITGKHSKIIRPRIEKSKAEQSKRIKEKAEVFTPSWVCNKQNNLVDERWFGYKHPFNTENNDRNWEVSDRVDFSKTDKSWIDYVADTRLEMTCGETPYIVSRYDTVSGDEIPLKNRIGFLDRKLRVVGENTSTGKEWIEYSINAVKSVYGYELQGDNLLIARQNVLMDYVDYYTNKFHALPSRELIIELANIISWNFWQMDGISLVIPYSCHKEEEEQLSLFGEDKEFKECPGCLSGDPKKHNGIRCCIMDWQKNKKVKYVSLLWGKLYA